MAELTDGDLIKMVALYKMIEDAAAADASDHIKHEAANAFPVLLRLLAKYGLAFDDMPELKRRREQAQAKTTASAAPADDDAPALIELIEFVLKQYIAVEPHEYTGIALWILHTHVFERFQISPRLAALSPVPGCGKSNLLKLCAKLTPNAERHDNISAASLFRLIDERAGELTLLLDEADNLGLKIDRVVRSVLNSGHAKGGLITRTIQGQPKSFSTFAPAAIGAIGTLTLPLLQRSIAIPMHKTQRTDLKTIEDLGSPEEAKRLDGLRRLIVEWAHKVAQFDLNPPLPKILRNRPADNWRVLFAIADSFGSAHWSKVARQAAEAFAGGYSDEAACVALLHDIRLIFRRLKAERIKSKELADALHELEDGLGIWSAWCGESDDQSPHAITQGEIATLLRRFDRALRPKPLFELGSRQTRGKSARGYYASQFEKWWAAYCPEDGAKTDNVRQLHPKSKSKPE